MPRSNGDGATAVMADGASSRAEMQKAAQGGFLQ
jgi:hypothetical protein